MDIDSSPSESDCIDDTGCEDLFQSSYWDINYVQAIENEDGPENEEYSDDIEQQNNSKTAIASGELIGKKLSGDKEVASVNDGGLFGRGFF